MTSYPFKTRTHCRGFLTRTDCDLKESLDSAEIGFGIHANGVELSGLNVNVEPVFQKTKLLQTLSLLQSARWQRGEELQRAAAVGVQTDVLPVLRLGAGGVAMVRDGGSGEVQRATVGGGDHLDGVGVGDVLRRAKNLQR